VAHDSYRELGLAGIKRLAKRLDTPIFDLKGALEHRAETIRL
jgi:hypothetical protein